MRLGAVGYALAGVFAGMVLLVLLWPARALLPRAEGMDGLTLRDVGGVWWRGEAQAAWGDLALGWLTWQWAPARLVAGELRFDWQLQGAGHALAGSVGCGVDSLRVAVAGRADAGRADGGRADAGWVSAALAGYGIGLAGEFAFEEIQVRLAAGEPPAAAGTLRWSGGLVRYRLGDRHMAAELPPLVGALDVVRNAPELAVATAEGAALFDVRLAADGWLRASLTRRFVDLAGNPWPGTGRADAVVVEVAERVRPWTDSPLGLCGGPWRPVPPPKAAAAQRG